MIIDLSVDVSIQIGLDNLRIDKSKRKKAAERFRAQNGEPAAESASKYINEKISGSESSA